MWRINPEKVPVLRVKKSVMEAIEKEVGITKFFEIQLVYK